MPWHRKATKDAISCDKPRLGANILLPGGFRMGQPIQGYAWMQTDEYIVSQAPTGGIETS